MILVHHLCVIAPVRIEGLLTGLVRFQGQLPSDRTKLAESILAFLASVKSNGVSENIETMMLAAKTLFSVSLAAGRN